MAAPALSIDELEKKEEEEFRTGPLSVLTTSVKTNSQVRIHKRAQQAHGSRDDAKRAALTIPMCALFSGLDQLQE